MAIDYRAGQTNKGPSNSTGMVQTPGTQLAAMQNVGTGANINPNMPAAPQLAKQQRSSYQQGLARQQAPRPVVPRPQVAAPDQRSRAQVFQGQALDQGRGYNIFSGMDVNQINQMNQSMGLSNMTALPSLQKTNIPVEGYGLSPQRQMSTQLMSTYEGPGGSAINVDEDTGDVTVSVGGQTFNVGNIENAEQLPNLPGQADEFLKSEAEKYKTSQEEAAAAEEEKTYDPNEMVGSAYDKAMEEYTGIDPEKKQQMFDNLDSEYAVKLDAALAGIDRQAAMMGTFGSGAHMFSMNNALAQVLSDMADEYNKIEMLDVQVGETDFQQSFQNSLAAASWFQNYEGDPLNEIAMIDENLISQIGDYIQAYAPAEIKGALTGQLGEMTTELWANVASGEITAAEAVGLINNQFKLIRDMIDGNPKTEQEAKTIFEASIGDMVNPFGEDLVTWQEYTKNLAGMTFGGPVGVALFGANLIEDLLEDIFG